MIEGLRVIDGEILVDPVEVMEGLLVTVIETDDEVDVEAVEVTEADGEADGSKNVSSKGS